MNLLQAFIHEAEARQQRCAIIGGNGEEIRYDELLSRSASLAAAWKKRGLRSGDRVLLAMPLGIPLYVSLIALWRLGAAVVFPEPALGIAGLRHAVATTKPKAFLSSGWFRMLRWGWPGLWPILSLSPDEEGAGPDRIESVGADHPALISFTSGSTGMPKTIVRSHGFLAKQNESVALMLRSSRDETDLVAFPVFVLANLALGATSVLPNWNLRRHDFADARQIAAQIGKHRVTRALVPPALCERMSDGPILGLRAIFTGGGPVFPDLIQRLAAKAPGADIVSVYGSTEAEPIAHQRMAEIGEADWQAMRDGAGLLAGHPVPGIALHIRNDEIVVTGAHVNKTYLDPAHNASTKLAQDGEIWHRTGDAGRLDGAGRLWLLGRLDGRAGALFPFGVEAAARFWPRVRHAALVAVAGKPVLAIEGDPGARGVWAERATPFDVRVVIVTSMPLDRRHRSKIDYPALRRLLRAADSPQER